MRARLETNGHSYVGDPQAPFGLEKSLCPRNPTFEQISIGGYADRLPERGTKIPFRQTGLGRELGQQNLLAKAILDEVKGAPRLPSRQAAFEIWRSRGHVLARQIGNQGNRKPIQEQRTIWPSLGRVPCHEGARHQQ